MYQPRAGFACALTSVYTLAILSAAIRVVTTLFDRLQEDMVALGIDCEAMKAGTLRLLAARLFEGGLQAVSELVRPAIAASVAASRVKLQDVAAMPDVEILLRSAMKVSVCYLCKFCYHHFVSLCLPPNSRAYQIARSAFDVYACILICSP